MKDEITEIYEKEEDISKLTTKLVNFSFNDLIKTDHFYYSIAEKATDINLLKENFRKFEKVRLVSKRKHKNGEISYDFYYELANGTYLVFGIRFDEKYDKPILLNGFKVDRNFKHFKKSLLKAYKKQLIG